MRPCRVHPQVPVHVPVHEGRGDDILDSRSSDHGRMLASIQQNCEFTRPPLYNHCWPTWRVPQLNRRTAAPRPSPSSVGASHDGRTPPAEPHRCRAFPSPALISGESSVEFPRFPTRSNPMLNGSKDTRRGGTATPRAALGRKRNETKPYN